MRRWGARPGRPARGYIRASVMSRVGAAASTLPMILGFARTALDAVSRVNHTGDLSDGELPGVHPCHMFTWQELESWLASFPVTVRDRAAASVLTTGWPDDELSALEENASLVKELDGWEEYFSREPGCLDAGHHILVSLLVTKDS